MQAVQGAVRRGHLALRGRPTADGDNAEHDDELEWFEGEARDILDQASGAPTRPRVGIEPLQRRGGD
jgi:hypothetical protein